MCANYAPTPADRLARHFGVVAPRDDYVSDAYPGHVVPVIGSRDGRRSARMAVFGLIPPWSRDGANYRQCYNARTETVAQKPSFRHAWQAGQRCVIPADAFCEPCYESGRAVRWRIEPAGPAPLAIAGLWERWRSPAGEDVLSCTMLTINADEHPVMKRFHPASDEKRSVVLLPPERIDTWLAGDDGAACALIAPFAPESVRTVCSPRPARAPRPARVSHPNDSTLDSADDSNTPEEHP